MNKLLIVPTVALAAVLVTGLTYVGTAQAESSATMVRFNLNSDEVRKVFDEHRTERQKQHQAMFDEKLNQSVSDGKISVAQKDALLGKHLEMKTKHIELQNMSKEDRYSAMNQHHEEMEAWANESGIDLNEILGGNGMTEDRMGHQGRGEKDGCRHHQYSVEE